MKKRKELDALVSNGKIGPSKRNCLKKASGSCSAHELLRHDTDSSDMEDFSILQPRRKGRKKHGNRLCVTSVCLSLCQFILVITSCLVSGVAIWLHIGLREDIDLLRAHLQKVEAGSSSTPELLHGIHAKFQQVDSNMSTLFVGLKKNTADIERIVSEVKLLKDIAQDLKESIAAAPAIQELPKNVKALSESVVNFGSKINALESNVKELKDQQSNIQSLTSNLSSDLDSLKNIIQDVTNSTDFQTKSPGNASAKYIKLQTAVQETNIYVHNLEGRLSNVAESVNKMNSSLSSHFNVFNELPSKFDTINEAVELILNTTHSQKTLLHSLQSFIETNVSIRLDQLELELGHSSKSFPVFNSEYMNKTISDHVLRILNKLFHNDNTTGSLQSLEQAHDILVVLAPLLEKNSSSYIQNNHNATTLMKELLHESFDDMIASTDLKIQVLEQEVKNLSSCIQVNSNSNIKLNNVTTPVSVQASEASNTTQE